jgi:hemerythrin
MNYLEWDASLDTGIPEIDDQHRQLVSYINRLAQAKENGDTGSVREVLDRLIDYTVSHFSLEESLQEASAYRSFETHKSAHALFVQNVLENKRQIDAGADVAGQLLATLRSWLIYHIKHDDADYVPTIKEHLSKKTATEGGWMARMMKKFFP